MSSFSRFFLFGFHIVFVASTPAADLVCVLAPLLCDAFCVVCQSVNTDLAFPSPFRIGHGRILRVYPLISVSAKLPLEIIYRVKYRRFDAPSNLRRPAQGPFTPISLSPKKVAWESKSSLSHKSRLPRRGHPHKCATTSNTPSLWNAVSTRYRPWHQRSEGLCSSKAECGTLYT